MKYRLWWFCMAWQGNTFCRACIYACIQLQHPCKYIIFWHLILKSCYNRSACCCSRRGAGSEWDMFLLCVELRDRGTGNPVWLLLSSHFRQGYLVLFNYLGKSDPELFLPRSRWELPHVAQNGVQDLLSTSSQPAFCPVSLPGLAPWHQWANRSTFGIVHGSSISLSWQECLFTPLVVICLEKPAKSISYLRVLKASLWRMGGTVPALPPASEGPDLLFLNTGIVSSFVFWILHNY